MWKVLIADDEPAIRRGLARTIAESNRDLIVVAEAEDGEEALALAQERKPDLLLVDVCMPFLSGLKFLERLKAINDDCAIIIVSGHDEFEFAREAIRLGATDYILKPIDDALLLAAVDMSLSKLKESRDSSRYLEWAKAQLVRMLPEYRQRFLRDLVAGRLSPGELSHSGEFLDLRLPERGGMMIVRLNERAMPGSVSEDSRLTRFLALEPLLRELFPPDEGHYVFEDETVGWVVFGDARDSSEWIDAAAEITERALRKLKLSVVAAQGFASGPDEIADCYAELSSELAREENASSLVSAAREYMEKGYSRVGFSLEETAEYLKVSPGYLSRVLRRETDAAFTQTLTKIRVDKAVALLADPSMKVSEVADAVGFSSLHYFSRTFKRVMGVSPLDIRRGTTA